MFHNTEWSYKLWEQMELLCDTFDFAETDYISTHDIKSFIANRRKWQTENKAESPSLFSPNMIDKFVNDTADDFDKWFSNVSH